MRSLFIALLVTFFTTVGLSATAQDKGVNFEKGTFAEALAKAKKEKKMLFFDGYTTWCPPCKKMANEVFPDAEVGKYFNKNFINFKQDMESGEGVALRKQYKINAYPTFLILDGDGKELGRILGGAAPAAFIKKVQAAVESIKK